MLVCLAWPLDEPSLSGQSGQLLVVCRLCRAHALACARPLLLLLHRLKMLRRAAKLTTSRKMSRQLMARHFEHRTRWQPKVLLVVMLVRVRPGARKMRVECGSDWRRVEQISRLL